MPINLTPNDFKIIASKNKVVTDEVGEAVGGTIGGMGTTPISDIDKVMDEDGEVGGADTVKVKALNIANRGWVQDCVFSTVGTNQVNWGAGTLTLADGTAYAIADGTTSTMAAETYIYFDVAVSETAYQVTTTLLTALGSGKVMIAKAENNTNGATFKVLGEAGAQKMDGADLILNSVAANQLAASLLYGGALIIDTGGHARSGQTAFDTGIGWFLGMPGGTSKFSVGDSAGDRATFSGSLFFIKGNLELSSILNMISLTVANLPIPPSTAGFSSPTASEA